MIEAIILNTAQNFDTWTQMATKVASGASRFVRPAYQSHSPQFAVEVQRRINKLNALSENISTQNVSIEAFTTEIMSGVEYTPEEAKAHIEEISNVELMLRGLCGSLAGYKTKSVVSDYHLGCFRSPLIQAYDRYTAELEVGIGLAADLLGYLRQFVPPAEVVKGEFELTQDVMDGFLKASEALLQDAANGDDIKFV
ncbi:MAG: hypothetical protein ACPGF7_09890 [Pontibacterium sp.]